MEWNDSDTHPRGIWTCPFSICPSQAVAAVFVHLQPKLDREVAKDTPNDCQMSFSLPPLYNILFTFSFAHTVMLFFDMKKCNHQVGGSHKLKFTGILALISGVWKYGTPSHQGIICKMAYQ